MIFLSLYTFKLNQTTEEVIAAKATGMIKYWLCVCFLNKKGAAHTLHARLIGFILEELVLFPSEAVLKSL